MNLAGSASLTLISAIRAADSTLSAADADVPDASRPQAKDGWISRRALARRLLAHTSGMSVQLHQTVVDGHNLPGLTVLDAGARLAGLAERQRELVIGPDDSAPVGRCCMPGIGEKTVENRVYHDLTSSAEEREAEIGHLFSRGARG